MLSLLFFIFCVIVVVQLFYYLFLFGWFYNDEPNNLTNAKKTTLSQDTLPISVIIAAKNEAENLSSFLPKILAQKHPTFEVIIIADACTDHTVDLLNSISDQRLKHIAIPASENYTGNKKHALSKGIATAQHHYLLFTDADCYPTSENWIGKMSSQLETKEIVLGYGAYQKFPTFLNKLIRYETLLTAIQYLSYAKLGLPYMGVGRNLAYTKSLFSLVNGFEAHKNIKSGDDDLLINKASNNQNTAICIDRESFTISKPKTTFKRWFQQKRRHITTAHYYKPIHQFLLGIFYLSQLLFWLLAILLLAFSFKWELVAILVGIRFMVQYISIYNAAKKLNEADLFLYSPVLDFSLIAVQLALFFSNLLKKPDHW